MDDPTIRVSQQAQAAPADWPWPDYPPHGKRNTLDQNKAMGEEYVGWEGDFLDAYRNTGIVRSACAQARVSSTTVYKRRKKDARFQEAYDEAREQAVEILEAAAFQRAVHGTQRLKHNFHNGEIIKDGDEIITTYSDSLLMFLLRANSPRYRDFVDRSAQIAAAKAETERLADAAGWSAEKKLAAVAEVERMLRSGK